MSGGERQNRKALITGASSGIGRAICERLLGAGWAVVGAARFESGAPIEHDRFTAVKIDLADLDRLPERLKSLAAKHEDLDALVLNAGRGDFGDLEQFSYARMQSLMEINFLAHAFCARAFVPGMKLRRAGHLVFMGSEAGLTGHQKGSIYCASKFAIRGFAQALREECASANVRVTLINPGMVKTGFYDGLDFEPGANEANFIEPSDIADAVALAIEARPGTSFDEINLTSQKRVIHFKSKKRDG